MGREYLFRGKRSKDGKWIYGLLTKDQLGHYRIQFDVRFFTNVVDSDSVGQFIGRTDKNGTKIFDGDIISANGVVSFAVKYIEERLSFCLANTDELKLNLKCMSPWNPVSASWWNEFGKEIEIIGNIHDNPELIK